MQVPIHQPINEPIFRAVTDALYGGASFDIASLFAGGEKGFLYDISDQSALFQDDLGATPITASTQTVGLMNDLSGNGYHVKQATSGSRPQYILDGGGRGLLRVVGAKSMACASVDFSTCTAFTMTVGFAFLGVVTTHQSVIEHGTNSFSAGGFMFSLSQQRTGDYGSTFGSTSTNYRFLNTGAMRTRVDRVVTIEVTPLEATDGARMRVWVDGVLEPDSVYLTAGTPAAALFAVRTLFLFSRNGASLYAQNDYFFMLGVGRVLTDSERRGAEAVARQKCTVTPTYSIINYSLSKAVSLMPTYAEGSPYAITKWTTSATSVDVSYVSNMYATASGLCQIGIYVDGAYYSQAACTATSGTLTIALPVGSKVVSIVNGPTQIQATASPRIYGTYVTGATFNAAATQIADSTSSGMVIYGDSIAIGQGASPLHQNAWAMLVRAAYPSGNVSVCGAGAISLYDDLLGTDGVAYLSTQLASTSPAAIWLAIGTNDYGLNKWTAAEFGTGYAALLDALHTLLPSATIYCQTPILRTTETANGKGSTMGDYRTQISTAQAARSSYATLVDGTAFMTTASLSDGVHPTTAGHALYADAVKSVLGI